MNRLDRQPAPPFWAEKERQYLDVKKDAGKALREWTKENKSMATWFHECVRPQGESRNCAYCDAILGESSSETIDHFIPCYFDRTLGFAWTNLYPACQACNTEFKGTKWSCKLLRPDIDPVEDWIAFDPEDGRLYPAPEFDRKTRARVRLTIKVFGLNAFTRRQSRRKVWKSIWNAMKVSDDEMLQLYAREGPYRLVSRLVLASKT
jgi:uncharacterized protein (TIGR02646 family)